LGGLGKINMGIIIEEFKEYQADEISKLIKRNLLEINSQYYPTESINYLINEFTVEKLVKNSKYQNIYVAIEDSEIIGTGGLANYGSKEEPIYYGIAMFIKPELHGKGIGKQLLHRVEKKAIELGAKEIIIRAAKGSEYFYKKQGYKNRKQIAVKAKIEIEEMYK
jgi:predicted N-acetyltransferase YhbS